MKKIIFSLAIAISMVAVSLPTFAQNIVGASEEDAPMGVFEPTHTKNMKPVEMPYVREADIAWTKTIWRKIDFKQKFNQFFLYPLVSGELAPQNGLESFVTIIWKGIQDGTLKAYETDEFTRELTSEELLNRFERVRSDSTWAYNEELGIDELKPVTTQEKFDPSEVKNMELKEVWFIDKQYSVQRVRILGFTFTRDSYSTNRETGERTYDGQEPLFWIKYDGDMGTRQLLATKEAFNPNNDFDRRSFDDILIQRYFDSFITKESNVQNRSISSYLSGADALIESDRIKNEIMNKEIDMWEY